MEYEIEKETVLEIEFQPIFELYGWRITKQDEEIFVRGEFNDLEIGVCSVHTPCYDFKYDGLYLRGKGQNEDNAVSLCTKEEKEKIENKVKRINEKYGKIKIWRARKDSYYYYIDSKFNVNRGTEDYLELDDNRYKVGNYFKTEELAVKFSKHLKEKTEQFWREENKYEI